jgi:hypothetical protein
MKPTFSRVGLVLLAGIFIVSGCNTPQRFEDVSSSLASRAYVGARYELQVAMHLSGVNAPPGYEKTVDYYVIDPVSPSWSGPELITRDVLAPGTEIIVDSVRRCINCPFDEIVSAAVRISGEPTPLGRPIYVQLKYLAPDFARRHGGPPQ